MIIIPEDKGVVFIDKSHYIFIPMIQLEGMTVNGLINRLTAHIIQGGSEKKDEEKPV